MGADVFIWLLKLSGLALLGWGAWLCFMGQDRRSGRDRRGEGRGGRRSVDARSIAAVTAAASATAANSNGNAAEQAARMVA